MTKESSDAAYNVPGYREEIAVKFESGNIIDGDNIIPDCTEDITIVVTFSETTVIPNHYKETK